MIKLILAPLIDAVKNICGLLNASEISSMRHTISLVSSAKVYCSIKELLILVLSAYNGGITLAIDYCH